MLDYLYFSQNVVNISLHLYLPVFNGDFIFFNFKEWLEIQI